MTKEPASQPKRVLIVWNQVEEDIYEQWRVQGPQPLPWDPSRLADDVRTTNEEMDDLADSVRMAGYDVLFLNVRDDLERLQAALRYYQPHVVFNLIEYFNNDENLESGIVGLYELLGQAYTGSTGYALALCQRKHHAKRILEGAGLPTAPYFIVDSLDTPLPDPATLDERYPLIVKPALEDASGGIENEAVVADFDQLIDRIDYVLREFEQPVLIEDYIEGREIHVAILGNDPPEVLPPFEMRFDHSEFGDDEKWRPRIISYSAKWDPMSRDFYTLEPLCPAPDLTPALEERLGAIALRAYRETGCRDYARIDMRVTADGTPYILEVNPNPDLTDGSAFIMCAQASGRTYIETLGELLELAMKRVTPTSHDEAESGLRAPTDHLNRKYWQPPVES